MIKAISIDLQGTLTNSSYSNHFWQNALPQAFAQKHSISLAQAKQQLAKHFEQMGKFDARYYDNNYWEAKLGFNTINAMRGLQPQINHELLNFVLTLPLPKFIFSTTTTSFLKLEFGAHLSHFNGAYSSLSNFGIAGKTPKAYQRLAAAIGITPSQILHIGDNIQMDITSATQAGLTAIHHTNNATTIACIKQALML